MGSSASVFLHRLSYHCPTTIFQGLRSGHRHHLSATLLDLRAETTGHSAFDAVAIAGAAVSECGLSAGFRTPPMRPATRSEPAKTERAKFPKVVVGQW